MCIGFFQKGTTRKNEETSGRGLQGNNKITKDKGFTEIIEYIYDELLKLGYLYENIYKMDLNELNNTLEKRRMGLGYELWKLACLNTFVLSPDKMPESPEDASPELYPPRKTYKMPEFLKNSKYKTIIK